MLRGSNTISPLSASKDARLPRSLTGADSFQDGWQNGNAPGLNPGDGLHRSGFDSYTIRHFPAGDSSQPRVCSTTTVGFVMAERKSLIIRGLSGHFSGPSFPVATFPTGLKPEPLRCVAMAGRMFS